MVLVLPEVPSFGTQIARGLGGGLSSGLNQSVQNLIGKQHREREFEHDLTKQAQKFQFEKENQASKLKGEFEAEKNNYNSVKSAFGERFANLWQATGQGERTALTNAAIEAKSREIDLDKILSDNDIPAQKNIPPEKAKQNKIELPWGQEYEFKDIEGPSNLTPKELVHYESEIRKQNSPLFRENVNKAKGLKDTQKHLEILEELNPKIPEGLSRLAIDKEGNIRPTALRFKAVPKEVERFAKTVNDFLSGAKDIFGSRVTNYDIAAFKARLPGLLNSKEGRTEIIQQMKIFNEIESNYRNALKNVYNHYGLGKITEEQAEQIAEEMVGDREQFLRSELSKIGESKQEQDISEDSSLDNLFKGFF